MMIEVFIHPGSPLLRSERAEERMGMRCAFRFAAFLKLPDASLELFLLAREISFIGDHELLVRGGVPGIWLVAGEGRTNDGPSILPMNILGNTTRPEATSRVAEQCAIICATSILPHWC